MRSGSELGGVSHPIAPANYRLCRNCTTEEAMTVCPTTEPPMARYGSIEQSTND